MGVEVVLIGELAAPSRSGSQLLQLRPHSLPHVPLLLQAGSADLPALASSHRASARTLTVIKWVLAAACAYGLYRAIGPLLGLGGAGGGSTSSSSDSSGSSGSVKLQGQDVPDVQCSSSSENACSICLLNKPVAVYQPCFHAASCMACAATLCSYERAPNNPLRCPMCREKVEAISRFY